MPDDDKPARPPFRGGSWIRVAARLARTRRPSSSSWAGVVEGGSWYSMDGVEYTPGWTDVTVGAVWKEFTLKRAE